MHRFPINTMQRLDVPYDYHTLDAYIGEDEQHLNAIVSAGFRDYLDKMLQQPRLYGIPPTHHTNSVSNLIFSILPARLAVMGYVVRVRRLWTPIVTQSDTIKLCLIGTRFFSLHTHSLLCFYSSSSLHRTAVEGLY